MTDKTKGILSILASAFGFAVMATCVRLTDNFGQPISCFEKSFFRNLLAFLIALAVFLRTRTRLPANAIRLPKTAGDWALLLLRSVVGTLGIFTNFYALSHITIAEGQTLNKTAPFFTVLFAGIFLGERVRLGQILPLGVAFAGVLLIAKPGFAGADAFPLAMGLVGGASAGIAYTALRQLGKHQISAAFIVLFFSAFSCLASVPFLCHDPQPLTLAQVAILLGAGAGGALGQFGITSAYRFAAPRDIAVFDYSNVIFTALFGWVLFRQVPDSWSGLGIAAILGAALLMHQQERRRRIR